MSVVKVSGCVPGLWSEKTFIRLYLCPTVCCQSLFIFILSSSNQIKCLFIFPHIYRKWYWSPLLLHLKCNFNYFLKTSWKKPNVVHTLIRVYIDSNSTLDIDPDKVSHRCFFGFLACGFALILAAVLRRQVENLCQDLSASHGFIRDGLIHGGEVLFWLCQLGTLLTPNNMQQTALIAVKISITW